MCNSMDCNVRNAVYCNVLQCIAMYCNVLQCNVLFVCLIVCLFVCLFGCFFVCACDGCKPIQVRKFGGFLEDATYPFGSMVRFNVACFIISSLNGDLYK